MKCGMILYIKHQKSFYVVISVIRWLKVRQALVSTLKHFYLCVIYATILGNNIFTKKKNTTYLFVFMWKSRRATIYNFRFIIFYLICDISNQQVHILANGKLLSSIFAKYCSFTNLEYCEISSFII